MKKLLFIIVFLSGCTSTPYAIIDGSRAKVSDSNQYNVVIVGANGKMFFDQRSQHKIDPDFNMIALATTKESKGRNRSLPYKNLVIKAKPCVRYHVVAQHSDRDGFDNRDFEIKVIKEVKILHCLKHIESDEA